VLLAALFTETSGRSLRRLCSTLQDCRPRRRGTLGDAYGGCPRWSLEEAGALAFGEQGRFSLAEPVHAEAVAQGARRARTTFQPTRGYDVRRYQAASNTMSFEDRDRLVRSQ
jgi:hypothetical protein